MCGWSPSSPTVAGGRPGPGAVGGACSRTAWAFVPPNPKADTPARPGRCPEVGHAVGSVTTRRPSSVKSMWGLGLWKCRLPGIRPWCRASAVLIRPMIAGCAFEVAQVALDRSDEQRLAGLSAAADDRSEGCCLDGVSQQGARPVRFDVVDVGRVDPCVAQGVAEQRFLRRRVGCHEARRLAVLVHGGALDDGEHPVAVALGVGESFEHDDATALTPGDSVRRGVEGLAPAVHGQRARLFERGRDRRGQEHVDARRQCRVALPAAQAAAGQVHGHEGRRAGRVSGEAGPVEVEQIGHAVGGDAASGSGAGPRCQA